MKLSQKVPEIRRGIVAYLKEKSITRNNQGKALINCDNSVLGNYYNANTDKPINFTKNGFAKSFEFMYLEKTTFGRQPRKPREKTMTQKKAEYHAYFKTPEWEAKRQEVFKLRGRKCEKCPNTTYLQVHHLTYKNIYNEYMEDLLIVCKSCHDDIHGIIKVKKSPKVLTILSERDIIKKEILSLRLKISVLKDKLKSSKREIRKIS